MQLRKIASTMDRKFAASHCIADRRLQGYLQARVGWGVPRVNKTHFERIETRP